MFGMNFSTNNHLLAELTDECKLEEGASLSQFVAVDDLLNRA